MPIETIQVPGRGKGSPPKILGRAPPRGPDTEQARRLLAFHGGPDAWREYLYGLHNPPSRQPPRFQEWFKNHYASRPVTQTVQS